MSCILLQLFIKVPDPDLMSCVPSLLTCPHNLSTPRHHRFIHCKELAREALEAVDSGRLRLVPDHHQRAWHSWLEDIPDWCVSRQLWWGHRIPVYHVITSDGRDLWVAAASVEDARQTAVERKGRGVGCAYVVTYWMCVRTVYWVK